MAAASSTDDPPVFRNVGRGPAPRAARERYKELFKPHVSSFDYFLEEGLAASVAALEPVEVEHPAGGPRMRVWLESVAVARPVRTEAGSLDDKPLYPAEARERSVSYRGALHATICRQVGEDSEPERFTKKLGQMPIMVRSKQCHLRSLSPAGLIAKHEEGGENGGFFVVNGNERAIRLLIAPRRNHMMALVRPSFKNRGPDFTPYAIQIRWATPSVSSSPRPPAAVAVAPPVPPISRSLSPAPSSQLPRPKRVRPRDDPR